MKLIEMMAHTRLASGNRDLSNMKVVAWCQQACDQIFNELGGIENHEIRAALQETISDVVSQARAVVVIPNDPAIAPEATFNSKKCHAISKTAALTIEHHPRFKPAITVESRKVTFYFNKPFALPGVAKSSWPVTISYIRSPRRLIYLGGFQARMTDVSLGVKGKSNLREISVIWPDGRPSFDVNELSGSYISLQTSEDERTDYRIEEHPAGVLGKLYVNPVGSVLQYVDPNFGSESESKGFRTTIFIVLKSFINNLHCFF
jgi:hypothetical protein